MTSSIRAIACGLACVGALIGCGPGIESSREHGLYTSASLGSRGEEEAAIRSTLDAWHEAAARSDEAAYFELMTRDSIFLGTDATERWTRDQFRAYAHAPFSEGRGWVMRATRRVIHVEGDLAWFDEDLETVNLGPARGSGVLVRDDLGWRIAQYNLAITVPNERFDAVRALLATPPPDATPAP